eukprot:1332037-Pleurochrysis_carterae.AAC.2
MSNKRNSARKRNSAVARMRTALLNAGLNSLELLGEAFAPVRTMLRQPSSSRESPPRCTYSTLAPSLRRNS